MGADDASRLIELSVTTAVQLLEAQDGLLYPIAHALDLAGRPAFFGAYNGVELQPARALARLHAALRIKPYRCVAVVYGIVMPDDSGRNALCIEFESLDAPPETIFVPFVITRPLMRRARVITYAPLRFPGRSVVLAPGPAPGATDCGRR